MKPSLDTLLKTVEASRAGFMSEADGLRKEVGKPSGASGHNPGKQAIYNEWRLRMEVAKEEYKDVWLRYVHEREIQAQQRHEKALEESRIQREEASANADKIATANVSVTNTNARISFWIAVAIGTQVFLAFLAYLKTV